MKKCSNISILSSKKCGKWFVLSSKKCNFDYWSSEKTPSEIDFVIQRDDKIVPIEVKAEVNVKARSLRQFITNNPDLKGVRYSMLGYIDQGWVENVPLYAIDSYI